MSKVGVIVLHLLLIAFLVFAWLYRPPTSRVETAADQPAAGQAPAADPAVGAPAPTYTPLPTYTPYPTYTAVPTVAATATPKPSPTPDPVVLREEFDGKLASGWRLFNERKEGWNLGQPGWLELALSPGINCCPDASWENLLLHELPAGDYEVETKLAFAPEGGETAGLVLCNGLQSCLYFAKNPKYLPVEFVSAGAEVTFLRMRVEKGTVTVSASHDGLDWVEVDSGPVDQEYDSAGLAATQGDPERPKVALFDYFTIRALP
jgi:hypothetical protein